MTTHRIGRAVWLAVIALTLGSFAPLPAAAQDFSLNRFRPSETTEDGFAISRPTDLGHLRPSVQLHLDYAHDPLVYEELRGGSSDDRVSIVRHQLVGHLGVALGLYDRLVVFAGLPAHLYVDGEDPAGTGLDAPDGGGLGDLSFGGRIRLVGGESADDRFVLGAQVTVTAPTGRGSYRGSAGFGVHPELLFELRPGPVRLTLNTGANIGDNQTLQDDVLVGDELTFGLGLAVPVYGSLETGSARLDAHAQIYGATAFRAFFERETTPLEATAGVKLHHQTGVAVGVAAGGGITRGVGSPDVRAILTVGWARPAQRTPVSNEGPADTDGDGLLDPDDDCPTAPEDHDDFRDEDGCPEPDNDGDGFLDVDDQCPIRPGDAPAGCPAVVGDSDGDGIRDDDDLCDDQPEDFDDFDDEDGCPDTDNDSDGLVDASDECPNEPGPIENRGCPDADRDGDTVVDRLDNCPDEPGPVENHGCREEQQVIITDDRLEILDQVYFETNKAVIRRRSFGLLANVASVLMNHPELSVRIEGHTDDRGSAAHNLELSTRRAESVRAFLVDAGVSRARLTAEGHGETRPIETNATREGRAANRRVEFNLGTTAADARRQEVDR
ncbi:MAG: OmpA family protein [Deltaproteobacteria bacterium]|nr:OmpA family protein [Deltaproteobacteria bacterium]